VQNNEVERAGFDTFGNLLKKLDGGGHHVLEQAVFDTNGQPILNEYGVHKWTSQFDVQGNEIQRAYFDTQGQLLKTKILANSVSPDSQAQKLGIQKGDIFTHYDGEPISERFRFAARRNAEPSDGPAKELKILRDDKELTFMVLPGNLGVELKNRVVQKEKE
jgi:S1-C subfamily serine protease